MDAFPERLITRAATIDELLSDDFEPLAGQQDETALAARRLVAWCRSGAGGDWSLFGSRLERDGWSIARVLERFGSVRLSAAAAPPAWIDDAVWIEQALRGPVRSAATHVDRGAAEPCAFEHLFATVVEQAAAQLWSGIAARAAGRFGESARACLRRRLLAQLSALCAPAIYERFAAARKADATRPPDSGPRPSAATSRYDHFVAAMKAGGFRRLFEDKPVLLRLIATVTRQWIDTSREFVRRLDADIEIIRHDLLHSGAEARVARIEGGISDPHHGGHSVQIVSLEDGSRFLYKPKDLRLDAAWHGMVGRLNRADPPIDLQAVRAIARDGYGWTEFIEHTGCTGPASCERFFRRAGAWLALLHCFAATDMHQENMIAAGDQPVPIDLEMILQAGPDPHKAADAESEAFDAATALLANSVMMVGLLPTYDRSPDNTVFAVGGLTADWNSQTIIKWNNINSDEMRPAKSKDAGNSNPNLPHVDGRYAKFGEHLETFVSGFAAYAKFLLRVRGDASSGALFDGFAGVAVRKVVRPTRFYDMLLQRLKNHKTMDDGVAWSAQADFIARLAEWDKDSDPTWPLHKAERSALLALNVPHFVSPSDGNTVADAAGIVVRTAADTGLARAQARLENFDDADIAWQVEVIRQNTNSVVKIAGPVVIGSEANSSVRANAATTAATPGFAAEADRIAGELSRHAIRRGPGAAWIGLDWLGDFEVFQLVPLGPGLYNGVAGIAVFLAAHAAVSGHRPSGELARAAIAHLRKTLKSRSAARLARSMGIGGATGLGSIVYALAVMAKSLADADLLALAAVAAELCTDDLIAADKQLDVIGGSAGAILGLLRLYRDSRSDDVLGRAIKCGEHLVGQSRLGPDGAGVWTGRGHGARRLNGMSHGAAGFAYALASLAAATGREAFAKAAAECIAFENSSYDAARSNWPDLRADGEVGWPCQWCHGAPGIGLARIAMTRNSGLDAGLLAADIRNAVAGVERGTRAAVDTLCCGTLGGIEFICEAGAALKRSDLRENAAQRLTAVLQQAAAAGDYRWNSGKARFNLGLFRGLAGVGYTLLRQIDASLPNVLIWE